MPLNGCVCVTCLLTGDKTTLVDFVDVYNRSKLPPGSMSAIYDIFLLFRHASFKSESYQLPLCNGGRRYNVHSFVVVYKCRYAHDRSSSSSSILVVVAAAAAAAVESKSNNSITALAPKYLAELCVPVADVAGCRQLRSASRGLLNYVWNSLPEHIRQSTSIAVFKRSLKTFLLQQISHLAHYFIVLWAI